MLEAKRLAQAGGQKVFHSHPPMCRHFRLCENRFLSPGVSLMQDRRDRLVGQHPPRIAPRKHMTIESRSNVGDAPAVDAGHDLPRPVDQFSRWNWTFTRAENGQDQQLDRQVARRNPEPVILRRLWLRWGTGGRDRGFQHPPAATLVRRSFTEESLQRVGKVTAGHFEQAATLFGLLHQPDKGLVRLHQGSRRAAAAQEDPAQQVAGGLMVAPELERDRTAVQRFK